MNGTYQNYSYYRDQKGLSDYQISQYTGVTRSTISDWKHERHQPQLKTLQKIADFLGVEVNAFYNSVPDYIVQKTERNPEYFIETATQTAPIYSKSMVYGVRLPDGQICELSKEEHEDLQTAIDIFIESWLRSKKLIR